MDFITCRQNQSNTTKDFLLYLHMCLQHPSHATEDMKSSQLLLISASHASENISRLG
jgi:hypothetical protein